MRVLVTGAKGMVGSAFVARLKTLRDGKDRTRPHLCIKEIFAYDRDSSPEDLATYCQQADFVFHFAGVNRPQDPREFFSENVGFSKRLLDCLSAKKKAVPVMFASSVQATLAGRYENSDYGKSKKQAEDLFFDYAKKTGAPVFVYRLPNLLGHSAPNYNSAVSTFCYGAANDVPYTICDRSTRLTLVATEDLCENLLDLLEGKVCRCDYCGGEAVPNPAGSFCRVPQAYHVTLGEVADLLERFKTVPQTLLMPDMPAGSFAKKLFSLYLTYLPKEKFVYPLAPHTDSRGSFTEIMRTYRSGQVSVNISRPGAVKGEHWHTSKWEIFITVAGRGIIRERNLQTGETVSFSVDGKHPRAVYMVPGWTHSIENLSETEDMVTVMIANENFNPRYPDTYAEPV